LRAHARKIVTPAGLAKKSALSPTPAQAREQLRGIVATSGWDGDVDGAVLAVHEAVMNAWNHAGGPTSVTADVLGRALVVEVCDVGPGFDLAGHADRPADGLAERGRGLWLISQLCSSWELDRRDGETCLRLHFLS
jgi:anti-sigma regulatory factor (Ser/Thr protein kinase)